MLLIGLYLLFLTIMSVLGWFAGMLVEQYFAGAGIPVVIGIFMLALWLSWVLAMKITERHRPERAS
jgi:uncharacterized membrane protein YfcA